MAPRFGPTSRNTTSAFTEGLHGGCQRRVPVVVALGERFLRNDPIGAAGAGDLDAIDEPPDSYRRVEVLVVAMGDGVEGQLAKGVEWVVGLILLAQSAHLSQRGTDVGDEDPGDGVERAVRLCAQLLLIDDVGRLVGPLVAHELDVGRRG